MSRRAYPTDLTDAEFACLEPHLPSPLPRGRPWRHPIREILDAIYYVVRTGCQWRCLPHEYPPWPTVYCWFRRWRLDGTWERLNGALRAQLRVRSGRDPQPSAAILDSQSVRTTSVGGVRGYDGAKKLSGRKRHLLVDTQGLVLRVRVHSAEIQDRAAVPGLRPRRAGAGLPPGGSARVGKAGSPSLLPGYRPRRGAVRPAGEGGRRALPTPRSGRHPSSAPLPGVPRPPAGRGRGGHRGRGGRLGPGSAVRRDAGRCARPPPPPPAAGGG